ncbi:MAG: DUF188 domain-containing protein [Desulfobacteraceae bacterium]|nr:DUF188 domain-containing protein [Desulfobacteraceae bacterium]
MPCARLSLRHWEEDVTENDIVISGDIPLASRCLKKGTRVIVPRGRVFTKDSIGEALANREILFHLRELVTIMGGPASFERRDRFRFLQHLNEIIQAVLRGSKSTCG